MQIPTNSPYDQLDTFEIISEEVTRNSGTATIKALCSYDDRLDIANKLLGGLQNSDGDWSYTDPSQYPFGFDGDNICANQVTIVPVGDRDDNGMYVQAELTISYGPYLFMQYDESTPITICSVTTNCSAEQLPMPIGSYQWEDGTLVNDDDFKPSLVFPYVELKVVVQYTAEPLISDCEDLLGQVNQDDLTLPNPNGDDDTFSANTVLFLGVTPSMIINSQGYLCYTRELTFGIRDNDSHGWNGLWNPATAKFEDITSAPDDDGTGGGDPPYDQGDFSTLFQIQS